MSELADPRGGWTSASAAPFDALCPGRHQAQKGMPQQETEYSQFGTRIHEALAKGDGSKLTIDEFDIYRSCQEIEQSVLQKVFGSGWEEAKETAHRHERLWYDMGGVKHSGELDAFFSYKMTLLVVEYKTLPGQVSSSPENLQLRDQVCLAWMNGIKLHTEAVTVVIQPLVTRSPKLCTYTPDDVTRSIKEMRARILASNSPTALRVAGTPQCDYCRAKTKCLAYNQWAGSKLPVNAGLMAVPVSSWTPDQRRIFLENRAAAQKWLDTCEADIKRLLEKDKDCVPGWCLEDSGKTETITNPQAVFDRFAQAGGNINAFMKCVKITKGTLKEELAAVTGMKGETLNKCFDLMLDGLVESKPKAKSLGRIK